ncbi:MAG: response regulator transcription factor [Rhodospirillales bacterium]|nr:response regulator transcription factor [Rhodospirillales bacterium]
MSAMPAPNEHAPSVPHVLVVDDDARLRDLIRRYLVNNGFVVTAAADAAEARACLKSFDFDVLVLDRMMPGEDGLALARALRAERSPPVLMLTAMGEPEERIAGLEAGVDDYLVKPFEPRELLLRLNAILRRLAQPPPAPVAEAPDEIRLGASVFRADRRELTRAGETVRLTEAEATLLAVLATRPGEAVGREELARLTGASGGGRAVDVQVTRLRRKIEDDPRNPRHLVTARGRGYALNFD